MSFIIDTEHGILSKYFPQAGETEITVPDGIRMIDREAFAGCDNLYAVWIPEGVENIGQGAFRNCKNLLFVKLPESLSRIGIEAFSGCEMLGQINIPEKITVIHDGSFMNCKNLRTMELPKRLEKIGDKAFCNCISLKKINIPEHVKYLGIYAFSHCEKLTSVVIPKGISRIYRGTFFSCYELRFVMIPPNVEAIESMGFPTTTVLHFQIKNQLFSVVFGSYTRLIASFCQPELPENTEIIIRDFIQKNDSGNLQRFLECGFVQDDSIDELIQFAIKNQKYESQVVLMDYKHKHIGYQQKNWEL